MATFVPISTFSSRIPDAPWAITRREIVPAPPERVWRALTDPDEVCRWWSDAAEIELTPGGRFAFHGAHVPGPVLFGGPTAAERPGDFELLDVSPPEHFSFRWYLGDIPTVVSFRLENQLELTILRVVQTAEEKIGWKDAPESPNWWWLALPSLRNHVEGSSSPLRLNYEEYDDGPLDGPLQFEIDTFTFPWVIWQKLTDPVQLMRWWGREAEISLVPGGTYRIAKEFMSGPGRGPEQILEFEESRSLIHDWLYDDGTHGEIEWRIEETDESTRVTLTDRGPWPKGSAAIELALDRAVRLVYFKQICERGVTPFEYQAD